ncbi:MAG TPA: ATP-dependent Clp protease adaptor ClpS [Fibrobacteraceae bacterium]|nr:ATP-dependent Clp protease adaptor ClpS [Fibrobacteraceae bacterium]
MTDVRPEEEGQTGLLEEAETKVLRSCKVVLFNDEDHTYDYVVEMLVAVCSMAREQAFRCAVEVDLAGRSIVFFGSREACARISGKINTWGADHRLIRSRGSMNSAVETQ